jgi:hypothetical protein
MWSPGAATALILFCVSAALTLAPVRWQDKPKIRNLCGIGAVAFAFLTVAFLVSGILEVMGIGTLRSILICVGAAVVMFGVFLPKIIDRAGWIEPVAPNSSEQPPSTSTTGQSAASHNTTNSAGYIVLRGEIIDRNLQPQEYARSGILTANIGVTQDLPQRMEAAFARDARYPVASQHQLFRITVTNAGPQPIVRIWLDFPVQYQLSSGWPSSPNVPTIQSSPLNPLSVMPADPNGAPLILQDTPVVIAPNERYVFQFRNISKAYVYFNPLPSSAQIVTSAGDGQNETARVQSSTTFGPSALLAPDGGIPLPSDSREKKRS